MERQKAKEKNGSYNAQAYHGQLENLKRMKAGGIMVVDDPRRAHLRLDRFLHKQVTELHIRGRVVE